MSVGQLSSATGFFTNTNWPGFNSGIGIRGSLAKLASLGFNEDMKAYAIDSNANALMAVIAETINLRFIVRLHDSY
jgi:hypothetical protein